MRVAVARNDICKNERGGGGRGTRGRVSQRRFTAGCVNTRKRADLIRLPRDARC